MAGGVGVATPGKRRVGSGRERETGAAPPVAFAERSPTRNGVCCGHREVTTSGSGRERRGTVGLRSRRFRCVAVAGVVVAIVAAATACNFGGPVGSAGLGCNGQLITQEDRSMDIHYNSLTTQTGNAVTYSRGRIDATNVNTASSGAHSSVDADVRDAAWTTLCGIDWWNEGGETLGVAVCQKLAGNECDSSDVSIDSEYMTSSGTSTASERWVALHELLHTLGLAHHSDPDFSNDVMWPTQNQQNYIGPHNVEHINGYY